MSGSLTYLGEVSVGGFVPGVTAAHAAILGELRAKHAGYVAALAKLTVKPPSIVANIAAVGALLAALQGLVAVKLPGLDFQIALLGRLILDLDARIAVLAGLPFATAGVEAFVYEGDCASFGATVQGAVGGGLPGGGRGGSSACYAVIAATQFQETFSALRKVLV